MDNSKPVMESGALATNTNTDYEMINVVEERKKGEKGCVLGSDLPSVKTEGKVASLPLSLPVAPPTVGDVGVSREKEEECEYDNFPENQ